MFGLSGMGLQSGFRTPGARNLPRARFFGTLHGPQLAAKFNRLIFSWLRELEVWQFKKPWHMDSLLSFAEGDGTQDDLVRPENGWQVAPDDLSELQNAIYAALANPDRLRKMGRESFRIVSQEE